MGVLNRRLEIVDPGQDVGGLLVEGMADLGHRDLPRGAVEKPRAQFVLKLTNLPADRAVGDVQLTRRLTHAFQPGSGFEGAQSV